MIVQCPGYMIAEQIRLVAGVGLHMLAVTEGHLMETRNTRSQQGSSLYIAQHRWENAVA